MYELPTSIKLGDKEFKIRNDGDFRLVLDCFNALNDSELTEQERLISCLIIFYEDLNSVSDINQLADIKGAIQKMYDFFICGEVDTSNTQDYKLIDWDKDSQMIAAAINNVAKTEVRSLPYLHWWTFMGYYISVGDSLLATVVGIRNKIVKHKKLEKYEEEFRKENPQYFVWDNRSLQQKLDDELIKNIWNNR